MRFAHPSYFLLLWSVPPLILFHIWASRKKKEGIERFVSKELKLRLLSGVSPARQHLKAAMLILSIVFGVTALTQPKWGFHWEEVQQKGIDILIAVDVSKSMLAQDISPNRLERSKRKISDFLKIIKGDRIGLIAFSGTAFLQCPLTLDHGAVQLLLEPIDTETIPVPGTALSEAIRLARKVFERTDRKSRALILITDGEDTLQDPLDEAKKAASEGIRIYPIGVGQDEGSPIPESQGGGFKKDRQGQLVLSRLNETQLQKIALETGGSYVRSVTGDLDLEKIYEDIIKNTQSHELQSGRRKRFEERFQWPLMIALICLLLEAVTTERKRLFVAGGGRFLIRLRKASGTAVLCLMMGACFISSSLIASPSEGQKLYEKREYDKALQHFVDAHVEEPTSLELKYNLASTYYKMNRYQEAEQYFTTVALQGEKGVSQRAHYNLGNSLYRQGRLEEALQSYQKAVELDPKDKDAQHNLEFVRKEIKRRLEESKKEPPPPSQNKTPSDPPKAGSQPPERGREKDEKEKGADASHLPPSKRPMTQEEAQQWLSNLRETKKRPEKSASGKHQKYQVEKDW